MITQYHFLFSTQVEVFHDERREVLNGRKDNRAQRNEMKEQLLLTAENMQVGSGNEDCSFRKELGRGEDKGHDKLIGFTKFYFVQ